MIDRHRSYEDTSYIVISELLNLCGYKQTRHKPKIFFEIIKCLLFLCESNMIEITSDFDIYITLIILILIILINLPN